MNVPKRITLSEARAIVDVGIITIKSEELAAVLARLPPEAESRGQTQYNIARFVDRSGAEYHAAIVRALEQGDLPAQAIGHALVTDLNPPILVIVGIAGGRPEKEFTLGDVIVANRMFDFTVSAASADGTVEFATRSAPAHRVAGIIAANLTADADKYGDWNSEASIGMPRPPVRITKKNLKGPLKWQQKVREALGEYFGKDGRDRQPIVLDGAIGSASTHMKDPSLFAEWLDKSREVKAVDMEIAGAHEAARSVHGDTPVIVIRALSDVVGFKRDSRWTEYACRSAAAFCEALLTSGVLPLGHDGDREKPRSAQPTTARLAPVIGKNEANTVAEKIDGEETKLRLKTILPSSHEHLHGRANELKDDLEICIFDNSSYTGVAITAIGGMGKTALAREFCLAYKVWKSYDVVLGVQSRKRQIRITTNTALTRDIIYEEQGQALNLRELIIELAIQLKLPHLGTKTNDDIEKDIIKTLRGRRVLIVLDNLETVGDTATVLAFLDRICFPPLHKALVTTRYFPDVPLERGSTLCALVPLRMQRLVERS